MFDPDIFRQKVFNLRREEFEDAAISLFQFQWENNLVYRQYCDYLGKDPGSVKKVDKIPFLPIEFFKNHSIKSGNWKEQTFFLSSGTTSASRSKNLVRDLSYYHIVCQKIFESTFGPLSGHYLAGILPSYQENPHSSLINMVDSFMEKAQNKEKIYLNNLDSFKLNIDKIQFKSIILFGVTHALMEDLTKLDVSNEIQITIIETGGMKGRRKEAVREEVYQKIQERTGVPEIYSEYGMTELTSQAYGKNGRFEGPEWLKIMIRDINDPFTYVTSGQVGGVNIIDLANVDTCAFIETKDLGKTSKTSQFEILGRFDNSETRGCSLLIQ